MNACSPGGSGTTIVHNPPALARTRGWDDADHWLKLPATATLVASARMSTNRTPAGVTGGGGVDDVIVAAHDAITSAANAAAAADQTTRIASGD